MTEEVEQPTTNFLQVDAEILRKAKIMICTPMYGGSCMGAFTQSMCDLATLCARNGIELKFFYLFNESLIQRARNYCADEFLRSDCTHMVFVDADISFNPITLLQLVNVQMSDPETYQIVAGPYPKKSIQWDRVAAAAHHEVVDPQNIAMLQYFGGDMVLNFFPGVVNFRMDTPIQVLEAGTGFMCITRDILERWKAAYPEMSYKPDHLGTENFGGDRYIHAFFHCDIDPITHRYLSEDYYFCQKTIAMGGTIHICPWMELSHTGSYTYKGSIAAIAALENALKNPRPSDLAREKAEQEALKASQIPDFIPVDDPIEAELRRATKLGKKRLTKSKNRNIVGR